MRTAAFLFAMLIAIAAPGLAQTIEPTKPSFGQHCSSSEGEPALSFDYLAFYSSERIAADTYKRVEFRNVKTDGVAIPSAVSDSGAMTDIVPPPGFVAFFQIMAGAHDTASSSKLALMTFVTVRSPQQGQNVGREDITAHGSLRISSGSKERTIKFDCVSITGNSPA